MIYNLGRVVPLFKGNYDAATTYGFLDVVYYDNSSFVALDTTTGNLPTDTSHWLPVALKGTTQDPTPAQMQEIINTVETYMEGNIVDSLSSTATDKPLSANMGNELDNKISNLPYNLINGVNINIDVQNYQETNGIIQSNNLQWNIWRKYSNDRCLLIPVEAGSSIYIHKGNQRATHYGFLDNYPTIITNSPVNYVEGTTLNFLGTEAHPEVEATIEVPLNAKYLYIKSYDTNVSYLPSEIRIFRAGVLTDNDIVDNLDSTATDKSLSANQGKILGDKLEDLPDNLISPDETTVDFSTVDTIDYIIRINDGYGSRTWGSGSYYTSAIIPVLEGSLVKIQANPNFNTHYAFLDDYPTPSDGATPNFVITDGSDLFFITKGTSSSFNVPIGCKYIYVKISQGSGNIYTPSSMKIKSTRFLTELDFNNSELSELMKFVDKKQSVFIQDYNILDYYIGLNPYTWKTGTNCFCGIVPVNGGDLLYVKAMPNQSCHYGFFADYPTPVVDGTPSLIDNTLYYLNTSSTPTKERLLKIPDEAKYLYFKLRQGSTYYYPEEVIITKENKQVVSETYLADENYDTWIEENLISINYGNPNNDDTWAYKLYKIDDTVNYRVIVSVDSGASYSVSFFDENQSEMVNERIWGNNTETIILKEMEELTIPEGAKYIQVVYHRTKNPSLYTYNGVGALMKPLKNDGSFPTNKNIYCVSKIATPVIPWNYGINEGEDSTFEQTEVWSAWSFMLPYDINFNTGKKIPLVSFFHGSSGFITSEDMGYTSANSENGIVGKLRKEGFAVFDINGNGISYTSGKNSKHWGNPLAVATVKKAYTVLTERFNCRKGMVISGISMGGAISKSYCMTYPEDVVAAALEAPSDMGCTVRSGNSSDNRAAAWGYTNWSEDTNYNNLIGYAPTIKPLVIDSDGSMKYMNTQWVAYFSGSHYSDENNMLNDTNINRFYNPFPVEIKIWHGDVDNNVNLKYSQLFINTIRNANCNATLRLCHGCAHSLNNYPWVVEEVVNYIKDKLNA